MKRGFKNGLWLGSIWILVLSGPLSWGASSPTTGAVPTAPVIAHFHLSGELVETPIVDSFSLLGTQVNSLKGLVARMKEASEDDDVKAVVLTFDDMSFGLGQLTELRAAVGRIKTSGKKVYVHTRSMDTLTYSLLCSGNNLSVAPQSTIWLTGLYSESIYLKGLLDKIGVQADFLQMGDFKSAAETLTQTGPSQPAAENTNWLLDSIYTSLVDMIATSRGKTADQVRELIDHGPYLAEDALGKGLIDAVETREALRYYVSRRRRSSG